jgi:phosphopantothenoylcysteine decarboxylase/phosphopantothenate--cysteine ligase
MLTPQELAGKTVLVTAGPTREELDPVRFISNHSSGRMGYAIARAARLRGARVILVSGPVALEPPAGVELIKVESAAQMAEAVLTQADSSDLIIKAAAVADYRPVDRAGQKVKKRVESSAVALVRNPDILAALGERKKTGQILVGFAAETENLLENAASKLTRKNLDLIVANDVSADDAGFNVDTNRVTLLYRDGRIEELPLMSKDSVAEMILARAALLTGSGS